MNYQFPDNLPVRKAWSFNDSRQVIYMLFENEKGLGGCIACYVFNVHH
jgi:hypothetical protein